MSQQLKCLATVPCDLLLITISDSNCRLFSDINISQGSVATRLRRVGLFSNHFTANFPLNQAVKEFLKTSRFDEVTAMSLVAYFLEHSQCRM